MRNTRKRQKTNRCEFCGQFFCPDPRVGKRQRSCSKEQCQKKRKSSSQKSWLSKQPNYFHGRYENTRAWRVKNPGYQRAWRAKRREIQDELVQKSSIKTIHSIRLFVPVNLLKDEIQDKLKNRWINLPVNLGSCASEVPAERIREIQDEIAFLSRPDLYPAP